MQDDSGKENSFGNGGRTWRPLSFADQDSLEEMQGVEKCTAGNGVPGVFLPPEELVVVTVRVVGAVFPNLAELLYLKNSLVLFLLLAEFSFLLCEWQAQRGVLC